MKMLDDFLDCFEALQIHAYTLHYALEQKSTITIICQYNSEYYRQTWVNRSPFNYSSAPLHLHVFGMISQSQVTLNEMKNEK